MKRCVFVILLIVFSWLSWERYDRFSSHQIDVPLLTQNSLALTIEGEKALLQKYHYLGKGRQCFVFASEDGKFVLKFFNRKYLEMPWYSFFPFIHKKERLKRERRNYFYQNSYEIAFREMGDQILYVHLGKAKETLPEVQIFDDKRRKISLNLNELPFVVQRRGTLIYQALQSIYELRGAEGLFEPIDHFVKAISRRIDQSIADSDHDVEHNWGYIDGELFHLDPGRLYYDETLVSLERRKGEWWRATHRFRNWIEKKDPKLALYLDERISAELVKEPVGR